MIAREDLDRLQELGIQFAYALPGTGSVFLTPTDVLELERAPYETITRLVGATPDQIAQWHEARGCVQCAARTRSGRRCRGVVADSVMDVAEWVRLQGSFCHVHGDGQ